MTSNQPRILYTIVFFVLIFLSGFWLSRSGRPYSMPLLTAHKLLSIAAVVFLIIVLIRVNWLAGLGSVELIAAVITGVLFLATIATGGLLSTAKPMPMIVHRLHQITPFLTLLSTAVTLFLLFRHR